ncbi:MAG: TonB-dependent receptor [Bacteroidota bacterium]
MRQFRTLFLVLCVTLCPLWLVAQSGTISGKVIDSKGVLVGATVYLESSKAQGANSNINGKFIISGVKPGEQTVVFHYLGYNSKTVSVAVNPGEVSEVTVELIPLVYEGEEVIISTQRRGQTEAINQQLASDKIANIVSSDRIQELPDVNAAEAIGRLPGVALTRSGGEGQKVVIRGMHPKYSAITVNGVRLPSNSSTDRSVDLSLIAPELLDAIEVFKTPLPDMDAEAVGGTVNLRIRKAPDRFKLNAKGLYGFNNQARQFRDYKGVFQVSNRFLNKKLGIIAQGSVERFNRSGDFLTNGWRQGRTDSLGNTEVLGSSLNLEDRSEIRQRYNGSLSLDYKLNPKHDLSLFGVFSRTDRDQFRSSEVYNPSNPSIEYRAQGTENILSLYSLTLSGDHNFGFLKADWSLARSRSNSNTPYNYFIRFRDTQNSFDSELNQDDHPRLYFNAAQPDLTETILVGGESETSDAFENTNTALLNLAIPVKINKNTSLEFKFGGKYYGVDRARTFDRRSENFYYLGGEFAQNATALFEGNGGSITNIITNPALIGINTFISSQSSPVFLNEEGQQISLNSNIDPAIVRSWYESQQSILTSNRFGLVNQYQVFESITAGYAMLKFKIGDVLTVIPGFRYELSDNEYRGGFSTVSGRYGVNGDYIDTTTYQKYGELLPHLHIKFKPAEWFDIRASYSKTMARPDFSYITPRTQINHTSLNIAAGNPNLSHMVSTNYDINISAYKGTLGLLSFGVFRKDITNDFFPWTVNLADSAIRAQSGWDDLGGYELRSYTNLDSSQVYGFEVDLQTNLGFLPKPLNGIVLNVNYSRMFSTTTAFFQTSETRLIIPFPPIFETTYTTHEREVQRISQLPHILHLSVGYDIGKFSARVSGIYQGSRPTSYNLNKDFDQFSLEFWRWDASVKQGIGENWTVFLNLNNFSNQQDIRFTQSESFIRNVQTFGWTGTVGLQYQIR